MNLNLKLLEVSVPTFDTGHISSVYLVVFPSLVPILCMALLLSWYSWPCRGPLNPGTNRQLHRLHVGLLNWVKRVTLLLLLQAIQQRLEHGKVPCLCALVKAFSLTEADASVLLKDPTGIVSTS